MGYGLSSRELANARLRYSHSIIAVKRVLSIIIFSAAHNTINKMYTTKILSAGRYFQSVLGFSIKFKRIN